MEYTVIANSGIQLFTFPLEIDMSGNFKKWFREWYDKEEGVHKLDILERMKGEYGVFFYNKKDLIDNGYIQPTENKTLIDPEEIQEDGIVHPLAEDSDEFENMPEEIFPMSFDDPSSKLPLLENVWLPVPYFRRRVPALRFDFGAFNWARIKLVPVDGEKGKKRYDVILALDTRTGEGNDPLQEAPVFPDNFQNELHFEICPEELLLMDYCSEATEQCCYVNKYLRETVHPGVRSVSKIKGEKHKMSYIATYIVLIDYIAQNHLFPTVKMFKDTDVLMKDVDIFIDVGNSKTTALLVEDSEKGDFKKVPQLALTDLTDIVSTTKGLHVCRYQEPFEMRLAFRKADFGEWGERDSREFVYPSFVRLGREASKLVNRAHASEIADKTLSTYSSPKRYLWDKAPTKQEWQFLVLEGDKQSHILNIPGLSNQLNSNGTVDREGFGGSKHTYSRRSLMTFCMLEILCQARMQINSEDYRSFHGNIQMPRRLKRMVITCPITMSEEERKQLVRSAQDAAILLRNFETSAGNKDQDKFSLEVIPSYRRGEDDKQEWYYDEATCSQLVYLYGEIGHKYKGNAQDFFRLYGKTMEQGQTTFTLGSLDIGAGTSDLMINEYSYDNSIDSRIIPDPVFYDSFYFAGDDLLKSLISEMLISGDYSAIYRKGEKDPNIMQKLKNFFGHDYNGQSISQRLLRRDFNIQVLVPLACYYLDLNRRESRDCTIHYEQVFADNRPNPYVLNGFASFFGFRFEDLEWEYSSSHVSELITKTMEPLVKKISAMMYAYACDIIILSGRPTTLPPVIDLFRKYYAVAPNRLIPLSRYYVGDWYPYGNNTGYIRNQKTVVAVGAMIGYYSSDFAQLANFKLDKSLLGEHLKSTINYVEKPVETSAGQSYCITPENNRGEVFVKTLPVFLQIRQEDIEGYPERPLYTVDFNYEAIRRRVRAKMEKETSDISDEQVYNLVKDETDKLKRQMPFKLIVSRSPMDKEDLRIERVADAYNNDLNEKDVDIHIQSLGAEDCYWLDSGAFDF